jgi:hypothetical protein
MQCVTQREGGKRERSERQRKRERERVAIGKRSVKDEGS